MERTLEEIKESINDLTIYPITAKKGDIPGCFKEWRVWRGLTLREVEKYTGISNSYLSQLETGKVDNPSFQTVCALCECYNVNLPIGN